MIKTIGVTVGLFVIVGIALAIIFFIPKNNVTPLKTFLPKNCKVVDINYCKTLTIIGNGRPNETTAALFPLPKGGRVYSPVNGQLKSNITEGPEKVAYYTVEGADGYTYVFVFDSESEPQPRLIKAGEIIGTATGKKFQFMKNNSLAVSVLKDKLFNLARFEVLFR